MFTLWQPWNRQKWVKPISQMLALFKNLCMNKLKLFSILFLTTCNLAHFSRTRKSIFALAHERLCKPLIFVIIHNRIDSEIVQGYLIEFLFHKLGVECFYLFLWIVLHYSWFSFFFTRYLHSRRIFAYVYLFDFDCLIFGWFWLVRFSL